MNKEVTKENKGQLKSKEYAKRDKIRTGEKI
jgi:hypothetical protein